MAIKKTINNAERHKRKTMKKFIGKPFINLLKGEIITIDRWNDGKPQQYKVIRICRNHTVVKNANEDWAMPNNRMKDIIDVIPNQKP